MNAADPTLAAANANLGLTASIAPGLFVSQIYMYLCVGLGLVSQRNRFVRLTRRYNR